MVGPESIIPNIVEKVGDIDWDKAVDFLRRLVGAKPDEGLPVADEVAADGAGGRDNASYEVMKKEVDEYNAAFDVAETEEKELLALIEAVPPVYGMNGWSEYIDNVITAEREYLSALQKVMKEYEDMLNVGLSSDPFVEMEYLKIQTLEDSIKTLERIKSQLEQLDPSSGMSFFQEVSVENELETHLETLAIKLKNPRLILSSAE